nr:ATP-binding protein [Flavobacterium sp. ASV13]
MSHITYHIPSNEEISKAESRPQPLTGRSLPYNELDDRRFEILLYSAFKVKIENENLPFDNISLMSGVRDKGRDCSLTNKGINTGVIQCKKYASLLTKKQFAEEITKYALYSLIHTELIDNPENFTYYIAVSSGLAMDCSTFIDNFNTAAPQDQDLEKWIGKNIKNPTLNVLELEEVNDQVRNIFAKIKIVKLIPEDLDELLFKNKDLIPLFFNILKITDNSEIEKLRQELKIFQASQLNPEKIERELLMGSSSLKIEKNEFDDIPGSHIEREETKLLHDWIRQPLEMDQDDRAMNICLLAADAGKGKTVILKDLYDILTLEGTPVLGLKADKIQSSNLLDLQHKIGLSLPVIQFLELCKENHENIVIIIDQIDALSQSMSADRSFIEVFKSLIDKFTFDPNIRIIISVRLFDLSYDPALRVYKNIKAINVAQLSDQIVFKHLEALDICKSQVNTRLLALLKTPNHLNIFGRIVKANGNFRSVNSLQDLYSELWRIKISNIPHNHPVNPKKVKKLLYKIAEKMFLFQSTNIIESQFDTFYRELNYLESERLIKREKNYIQFFHQTFYDFTFAKHFVEKDRSLIAYIKEQEQSILIRSAVNMIFHYLRDYNPIVYHKTVGDVFMDKEIMHHIKHMIFCWIAYMETPTEKENEIIIGTAEDIEFKTLFFEHSRSEIWLEKAIQYRLLDFIITSNYQENHNSAEIPQSFDIEKYCFHKSIQYLAGHADRNSIHIWEFLKNIRHENTLWMLAKSIYSSAAPQYIELLENCSSYHDLKFPEYLEILHRIAEFNPSYSFEKILPKVLSIEYFESGETVTYQIREILKILSSKIPSRLISPMWKIIEQHLHNTERFGTGLYTTADLYNIDFDDYDSLEGIQLCYSTLASSLRNSVEFGPEEFNDFIEKNRYSIYEPVIWLILYSVKDREQQFKDTVYRLFEHSSIHSWLLLKSHYDVEFREIFQKAYPFFTKQQKIKSQSIIQNIKMKNEISVYVSQGKKRVNLSVGLAKYSFLKRLPEEDINNNPALRRSYLELARRFGKINDKSQNSKIMSGVVRSPIPEEKFEKMNSSDWINSFKKYNKDRERFAEDFLKGGIYEHSDAFRNFCKTEPFEHKIQLLELILKDSEIAKTYIISGFSGLAESDCRSEKLLQLFLDIIPIIPQESEHIFMIRMASELFRKKIYNEKTIQMLLDAALDFNSTSRYTYRDDSKETSMRGLITEGMNNSAGTAITALMQAGAPILGKTLFDMAEKILQEGQDDIKAYVLFRFAFLNEIDKERSFNIFNNHLQRESNIYVAASCIWSLQYMSGIYFKKLKPVLSKLINIQVLGQQDSIWLFSILHFSFLFNRPDAEELLLDLLEKNIHSRQVSIRNITKHFYHDENSKIKSQSILAHLLQFIKTDDKFNIHYSHMDHINLEDIYSFLNGFIKKDNFEFNDSFISYLTLQCNRYPFLSIELFNESIGKTKQSKLLRKSDSIAKFTTVAFNAVKGNDAQSCSVRKKLLESFGTMLKNPHYRNFSNRILDELS